MGGVIMLWRYRVRVAVGLAAAAAILAGVVSSASGTPDGATVVEVPATAKWTDTGITLTASEEVKITASGTLNYGSGNAFRSSPAGVKWPLKVCGFDQYTEPGNGEPFPAPGVSCWSLIGRIGSGPPIPVGKSLTFTAPVGGELYLGINDNNTADNSGHWTATVTTP
jgi:hypothetical protein